MGSTKTKKTNGEYRRNIVMEIQREPIQTEKAIGIKWQSEAGGTIQRGKAEAT